MTFKIYVEKKMPKQYYSPYLTKSKKTIALH